MKVKLISLLTVIASFTGWSATWSCSCEDHSLTIDEAKKIATISGATTGLRPFNLDAAEMEVQEWGSGERYLQFSVAGPSSWNQEQRDSEAFVTVSFNKLQDKYVSVIRRRDTNSGELEFLPFITMTCELRTTP